MIMNCAKTAEILPSIDEILNKADDVCPVQWAVNVAETAMKNTCGKGTFCRDGLKQLYLIGKDITLDKGTMEDIELLQELCQTMYIAADCELSGRCVELYRTSLETYYNDWTAHVLRHRCKAGVCANMKKGGAGAASAGIQINIPTGSAEGYDQVALSHTSAFDLNPKPLARRKKNRPGSMGSDRLTQRPERRKGAREKTVIPMCSPKCSAVRQRSGKMWRRSRLRWQTEPDLRDLRDGIRIVFLMWGSRNSMR